MVLDVKDLNVEQKKVFNAVDDNVLLLASAGTGKTFTLSKRVENIINLGKAKPSEILCITFTNRACKEMKERIKTTLGASASDVCVKTIHGFCYGVVRENVKRQDLVFNDFVILDEDDCSEVVYDVVEKYIKDYNNKNDMRIGLPCKLDKISRFIDALKHKRVELDIISENLLEDFKTTVKFGDEWIKNISYERDTFYYNTYEFLKEHGAEICYMYSKHLNEMNSMDFADLLINTYILLKDEEVLKKLNSRYKYINIDEVQDVNILEYRILKSIIGKNNVLICGDFFQTIYEWRGSQPNALLEDFKKNYTPVKIVLNENFRATNTLVNATFDTLKNMFANKVNEEYQHNIVSVSRTVGEKIKVKQLDNVGHEAQWIVENLKQIDDLSKVCILARSNSYCADLSQELEKITENSDISFMLVDSFKFFRRKEIKDVLAFLKLVCNKYDNVSLKRVLIDYTVGVGEETIKEIETQEYYKNGIRLSDFVNIDLHKTIESTLLGVYNAYDPFNALIENLDNILIFDVESTGVDVLNDDVVQIAAVKLDKDGNVKETFVRYIKPEKSVGDSFHVHGFSDEMLAEKGEPSKVVLKDFVEFSKECIVVGHNVSYDISIVSSNLRKNNLEDMNIKNVFDTLDIYRRFYPNLQNHKLEFLGEYFKINHKSTHNAIDDIEATRELLVRAIKTDIFPTSNTRSALIEKHINKFKKLAEFLDSLRNLCNEKAPSQLISLIIEQARMVSRFEKKGEFERIANLKLFENMVKELEKNQSYSKEALIYVLGITSLSNSEIDIFMKESNKIPIITIHQSKGLEYEYVFVTGMMQGVFPNFMSVEKDGSVKDEEKRAFYVAITRAKKKLFISYNQYHGRYSKIKSDFLNYLPDEYCE